MPIEITTCSTALHQLKLVYWVTMVMQVLITVVVVLLAINFMYAIDYNNQFHNYAKWLMSGAVVFCTLIGLVLYRKYIVAIHTAKYHTPTLRLHAYMRAYHIAWYITDIPVYLGTALYLITHNMYYMYGVAACIIIKLLYIPTQARMAKQLKGLTL